MYVYSAFGGLVGIFHLLALSCWSTVTDSSLWFDFFLVIIFFFQHVVGGFNKYKRFGFIGKVVDGGRMDVFLYM